MIAGRLSEKVASWDRLGLILGRFGGCPGGIFIDFILVFVLFRGHRRFRCETGPKTVWGCNFVENDAKLGYQNDPKSIQNGSQKVQNRRQHQYDKRLSLFEPSCIRLGSVLGRFGVYLEPFLGVHFGLFGDRVGLSWAQNRLRRVLSSKK